LRVAFDGFLNWTLTVTDWAGARLAMAGTVRYGVPERLAVAFTSVTVAGVPKKTICKGPLIALPLIFERVTVPLKVWLTRL
jgi:hypothetical protein